MPLDSRPQVTYSDVSNQIFYIHVVSLPNMCLTMNSDDEQTLSMQVCRGNFNSQKWRFSESGRGAYGTGRGNGVANAGQIVSQMIISRNYDLCLHFDHENYGGNTLQLSRTCNSEANQFYFY